MAPLLDIAYIVVLIVLSPFIIYKQLTTGKYKMHMWQRMGFFKRRDLTQKRCVLIHGVSVGEIITAKPLIEAIQAEMPDWEVVLSVTTDTAWAVAQKNYPELKLYRFPLDFSLSVSSFYAKVKPQAVILMELELWPNFIRKGFALGIPMLVANGRISEQSFAGYRRFKFFSASIFRKITHFLMQEDVYKQRLVDLGVLEESIDVVGTMKYDTIATEQPVERRLELRQHLGIAEDAIVFMGASTHAPEEKYLLEVYKALAPKFNNLRLLLVPRHPPRFAEVQALIAGEGMSCMRKTERDKSPSTATDGEQAGILGDTMGEMMDYYTVADIVFVGGSLISHGGQNMLEPAGLGKAILFGPHTFNFTEPVQALLSADAAFQVADHQQLIEKVQFLIEESDESHKMAKNAQAVVCARKGVATKTAGIIRRVVERELQS